MDQLDSISCDELDSVLQLTKVTIPSAPPASQVNTMKTRGLHNTSTNQISTGPIELQSICAASVESNSFQPLQRLRNGQPLAVMPRKSKKRNGDLQNTGCNVEDKASVKGVVFSSEDEVFKTLSNASMSDPADIVMVMMKVESLYASDPSFVGVSTAEEKLQMGMLVTALFKSNDWLCVKTPHGHQGYVLSTSCTPLCTLPCDKKNDISTKNPIAIFTSRSSEGRLAKSNGRNIANSINTIEVCNDGVNGEKDITDDVIEDASLPSNGLGLTANALDDAPSGDFATEKMKKGKKSKTSKYMLLMSHVNGFNRGQGLFNTGQYQGDVSTTDIMLQDGMVSNRGRQQNRNHCASDQMAIL